MWSAAAGTGTGSGTGQTRDAGMRYAAEGGDPARVALPDRAGCSDPRRRRDHPGPRRRPGAVGEHVQIPRGRSLGARQCVFFFFFAVTCGFLARFFCCHFFFLRRVAYWPPSAPVPALQSYWLIIHVSIAVMSSALFTLTFAMSALQLVQAHRQKTIAAGGADKLGFMRLVVRAEPRKPLLPHQRHDLRRLDLHAHVRRHLGRERRGAASGAGTPRKCGRS